MAALGYCVVADGDVSLIGHGVGGLTGAGYTEKQLHGEIGNTSSHNHGDPS